MFCYEAIAPKPKGGVPEADERNIAYFSSHFTAGGVNDLGVLNVKLCRHWQDCLVLIGNIEPVEIEKLVLPSRVGLHLGFNVVDDGGARSVPQSYMSLDGALHRVPVGGEGESAEVGGCVPVGFNEDTVCVVKGCPEIVEGIAKDRWCMLGRMDVLDDAPLFQRALLIFGAQSFSVLRDVAPQEGFKLHDVLIGPFNFQ